MLCLTTKGARGDKRFLMNAFKRVMDSASEVQMDYICLQYPGYFRFAKWMERLAQGIADGVIEVPKDHYNLEPEISAVPAWNPITIICSGKVQKVVGMRDMPWR